VAGKTFRGVGDDEGASPRRLQDDAPRLVDEEEDSRGLYSGPTVVDDQKVAEVLKKLRSLDQGGTPVAGVAQVVDSNATEPVRIDPNDLLVDSGPAVSGPPAPAFRNAPAIKSDPGPARIEDLMYPLQRATAIGRSAVTPDSAQPVTIAAESARSTTFGRSIHIPDVNAPDAAEVEISSGAVHYLDGEPPTSQPFPLADGAVTTPMAKPLLPAGKAGSSFADPARRFHTPYEPTDTQLLRSRKKGVRMIALMVGVGIAGGGWFVSKQFREASAPPAPPPAAAAPPAPAIMPLQPTPEPSAAPAAPKPAAQAQEPAAAAQPAAAREPAPAPEPAAAREPVAPPPSSAAPPAKPRSEPARSSRSQATRRSTAAPERRPAAKVEAPADGDTPPAIEKPTRRRRHAVQEDPDATLPPSNDD